MTKKIKLFGRWVRKPGDFFEKPKDIIEQRYDYIEWKKDKRFQAYLQRELKRLPNGKFKADEYVIIKYPLGANIKSIRSWLSEANRHFASLPAKGVGGYYDTHKGKWIQKPMLKLYSELRQPWGFFTNMREFLKKRNNWIKERFKHKTEKEGKTVKQACYEISQELPSKRNDFGDYSGAKKDPFSISTSAIEKIVRYK